VSLYKRYLESKNQNENTKIAVINEIISTYPKIIDYLYNRLDTCFGEHTVYLIHFNVNGEEMLKIGYTKNTVKSRFGEKRYAGQNTLNVVEIIRENKLPAKGAIEFEKKLKKLFAEYQINSNLTLPGKGEFFDIQFKKDIIEKYDLYYNDYVNIEGIKSPN